MKRYAIHISTYVTVEAENVAQASQLARKCYRLIGARSGSRRQKHERDMTSYRLGHSELKFGRPIRVADNGPERT